MVKHIYDGKIIAGPLVRVSSLGFRLLCARSGADVVFSEEIIANKLCQCVREVRPLGKFESSTYLSHLPTAQGRDVDVIEFVHYDSRQKGDSVRTVVFSTLSVGEGAKVVVQIGASDASIALQAAKLVEADVDGIDLNMGCPKKFSTGQGMGAALMTTPNLAVSILSELVRGLVIPVSVKIRCMCSTSETIQLIQALDQSGVHAITIHMRKRDDRYTTPASHTEFRRIKKLLGDQLQASLILNGDIFSLNTLTQTIQSTLCDGVMLCRAAMHNPLVFQQCDRNSSSEQDRGKLSSPIWTYSYDSVHELLDVMRTAVKWHMAFGACFAQIKYHVMRTLQDYHDARRQYSECVQSKNNDDLLRALGG